MTSNKKLTGIIQGRTLTEIKQDGTVLKITMDDSSVMTVQIGSNKPLNLSLTASPVLKVRQQDTLLSLDLEDGQSILLPLAEATSSVMVRDKNGVLGVRRLIYRQKCFE